MARDHVKVVQAIADGWTSGRPRHDLLHPDVEWDTSHFAGWPEKQVYRGRDEVIGFLDEWRATWGGYESGIHEAREAGDRVVVFWWQRMTGRGSGAPTTLESFQVITVRDGLATRIENYSDRGEALAAVGLDDG